WVASEKIQVVPTGVDLREYRPDWNSPDPERVVTFVGAMDWEPNIDAVEYFCTDIWPRVLAEVPDAEFRFQQRAGDRACAFGLGTLAPSRCRGSSATNWRRHPFEDLRGHGSRQGSSGHFGRG